MLGVYLNDHLAGATAGTELVTGVARAQDDDRLRRFAVEVAQDRAALQDLMKTLGVPARAYKTAAAWIGEKAARVKPNGHLLNRSPLSYLKELEIMRSRLTGRGWPVAVRRASRRAVLPPGPRPAGACRRSRTAVRGP